ncbi:hypothetical protein MKX03_036869 [Papaver bracteatum]|nr:hypothetical protein MKX03_036869 [Papaver bracteatum]
MAIGVPELPQVLSVLGTPIDVNAGDLASMKRTGQDQSNLANGEVNRGGTVGITAVKGLADVNDGGGVNVDTDNGKVTQGPKYEPITDIAQWAATVKRISVVTIDSKKRSGNH